jgi:hypothetical protein
MFMDFKKLTILLKGPDCEFDHLPASSAEINNAWRFTSTHPYVSVVWCLVNYGDQINENDMSDEYSTHNRDEKCIQNFGRITLRQEIP